MKTRLIVVGKTNDKNIIKGIEDYIPKSQYNNPIHREKVVESILENWKIISHNNEFSGILATSSIPEAIEYYRLLKSKGAFDLFKFTSCIKDLAVPIYKIIH